MIPNKDERLAVDLMSDRAIAEETLTILRMVVDVFEQMSSSPMARMIPGLSLPKVR